MPGGVYSRISALTLFRQSEGHGRSSNQPAGNDIVFQSSISSRGKRSEMDHETLGTEQDEAGCIEWTENSGRPYIDEGNVDCTGITGEKYLIHLHSIYFTLLKRSRMLCSP